MPDVYTYDDVDDLESSAGIAGGIGDNDLFLITDEMVGISRGLVTGSNEIM